MKRESVYSARLTWRVGMWLANKRLRHLQGPAPDFFLLDGPPVGLWTRGLVVALAAIGISVRELPFLAGHLRTSGGESVRPAARKVAFVLAASAARNVIEASTYLRGLDQRWQRHTIRLTLAKRLWPGAEEVTLRVLVANALAKERGDASATVLVAWPAELPPTSVADIPSDITLVLLGRRAVPWRSGRLSGVLIVARDFLRTIRSSAGRGVERQPHSLPGVLLLQEDDQSFDRSVRSQPHWLQPDDEPDFRTIILRLNDLTSVHVSAEERERAKLEFVDQAEMSGMNASLPITRRMRPELWRLHALCMFVSSPEVSFAAGQIARLMMVAGTLARVCANRGVSVFMTCENYAAAADAMQLIAAPMGITTLSYQYSNLPYSSLPMITTADKLATFSPMFERRFTYSGYPPPTFVNCGYVFSSSFPAVRNRAAERRSRMAAAGAMFVVGFFDESIQADKYGLVDIDEYENELLQLLEWMHRDPTHGVVFKTQFLAHQSRLSAKVTAAVAEAVETQRFEMPSIGRHRNVVLPCEVAASADFTIGHAFGGTAPLESALAGCRSLLVNSCNLITEADAVYGRVDVVVPSVGAALTAIDEYRAGSPSRRQLGDWGPILPDFDAFRDEGSASRLYGMVAAAVHERAQ